jgi:hypothetical protein
MIDDLAPLALLATFVGFGLANDAFWAAIERAEIAANTRPLRRTRSGDFVLSRDFYPRQSNRRAARAAGAPVTSPAVEFGDLCFATLESHPDLRASPTLQYGRQISERETLS